MLKNILFIALITMVLGCASVGREYNTSAINYIEIGKTTQNDVLSMMGEPMSIKNYNNGINVFNYEYAKSYFWTAASSTNFLEVQFYNEVAINKWQVVDKN